MLCPGGLPAKAYSTVGALPGTTGPDGNRREGVYAGLVVVLVSAMMHGLKPQRVQRLPEVFGIDRRTLERWCQWWLSLFVESMFWREGRARFMPPLCQKTLPLSLCVSFDVERRDRLPPSA